MRKWCRGGDPYAPHFQHLYFWINFNMAAILIGYDLNRKGQDYATLIAKIKELSGTWWHCLDSTWIIKCDLTAVQVRDTLTQFIDANDELLVVDITGDHAAWRGFDDSCSNWLKKNL